MDIIIWQQDDWFFDEVKRCDKYCGKYKGWEIYTLVPNGGIIGVSILNVESKICLMACTESVGKYFDEDWHIKLAHYKIDQNEGLKLAGNYG